MSDPQKLTSGELHIMSLMKRDAGLNGWCKASDIIMKIVKRLPAELVEYDELANTCRLTSLGLSILEARKWL